MSETNVSKIQQQLDPQLQRIRDAKRKANKVINEILPEHETAETAMYLAWEQLFALFLDSPQYDIKQLTEIAGIIQKLTSAYTSSKNMETKFRELYMKEDDHKQKKKELQATVKRASKDGKTLTPETLKLIEEQIKLL